MGDITLKKALEEYTTIYMPYRNFAERTREEYRNDLEDFIQFAEKSGVASVSQVGLPIIQRFIAGLEHKGYSSLTRKRKVVTLRSFFAFLYQEGKLLTNIASKIILPFVETTSPHVLTQVECDKLRAAAKSSPRDSAIIEILLQTGIKLSELTQLTLNDVDLDREDGQRSGFIRVQGKRGKKDRLLSLNERANSAIKNYLKARRNAENSFLFLNRFGKPVSDRGVQKMLRRYFQRGGMGAASVRTLRHTFGVQHIAKGASVKTIKEVMGLKDTRSMAIYQTLANGINV